MVKKILSLVIASLLIITCFAGCKKNDSENDGKTSVVTTVFPIYDWVTNIMGMGNESLSIDLIIKNGVDPHSFSPTTKDIAKISSCDVLICVGGVSDAWIDDVVKNAVNKDMVVIKLLDLLGDRAFIDEHHHEHEHEHEHEHGGTAYDEHVWLSVKNAIHLCGKLSAELCDIFPDESATYSSNAQKYVQKLIDLDVKYETAVEESPNKVLLFADRFPFRYLTEDYGLEHYAAFTGCSADSEASTDTVANLINKMKELKLKYIIVLENNDKKLANTIIDSGNLKDIEILTLDSMQSITEDNIKNGVTYISVMKNNLEVLKKALS